MKLELLFALSTLVVLPFWLAMIALPGWSRTATLLRSPLVLLPLPVLYLVLLICEWPLLMYLVEQPTLTGLAVVLGRPEGALIGWVHLLALDFFVGRWIYLDGIERGLPPLALVPVLWATFLVGPVGLLLYLLLRACVVPSAETVPADKACPASATRTNSHA